MFDNFHTIGQSKVCALPLGVAGLTKWPLFAFFLLLSPLYDLVTSLLEGLVLGGIFKSCLTVPNFACDF
jgi:hypothetical protein